jgi:O-antigen/teichoic acid export membrane protein
MPRKAAESTSLPQEARSRAWSLRGWLNPINGILHGGAARGGLLSTVDQGINSLANFISTVYLARVIDPTQFGVYSVAFLLIFLARSVHQGLNVEAVAALGAVMDDKEFRRYASASGLIQALIALAMAGVAAGGGIILTALGNPALGPGITALWLALFFWQLEEYVRRVFYTRGEIGKAALLSLIDTVFRLALLVFLGQMGKLDGPMGVYTIGVGGVAGAISALWLGRRYWTRRGLNLLDAWKRNWEYGRWLLGGLLATWAAQKLYPILAAGLINFAATGAYRALQNLVAPVHVLIIALDPFFTPRAARRYRDAGHRGLSRILALTYLIYTLPIVVILLLATLFAGPLLYLLYGATYLPYSAGIGLMAIDYALWASYYPLQSALKGVRRTLPIFVANIVAIVSMFTAGLYLIRRWEVYGTIAGQALNALLINIVLWTWWIVLTRKENHRKKENA